MKHKTATKSTPILLFLVFFIISCSKEEIQKEVLIRYELTDDVSPVKVKLNVDGDFHWSEWMFDNRFFNISNTEGEKGKSEWIFKNDGIGTGIVKFSGSDKNNVKYFGEAYIPLPDVATKIEFTGLSAKSLSANFPDLSGEYVVEFLLYDPFPTVRKSIIVNLKDRVGESIYLNSLFCLIFPDSMKMPSILCCSQFQEKMKSIPFFEQICI